TAGPGVTDTITAVATAFYANTPMLVIGGRHMIRQELKGGLQEMDHTRLFHSITKWAATAWQVDRLGEYVATAARHAFSGRGGPVFLDIPMDVQFDMVEETAVRLPRAYRSESSAGADEAELNRIIAALADAERVMVFAGAGSRPGASNRLCELAETLKAPTFVNSRARGSLPFGHEFLGNHARSQAMAGADLVLALGVDWDFRTSYGEKIGTSATVIQVDSDPTKIGWNRPAHIGVVADPMTVVAQLADSGDAIHRSDLPEFTKEIMSAEDARWADLRAEAENDSSPVLPQRFGWEVSEFFGPDSIVAVDGGDIVSTTARWLQVSNPGHVLDPGPFGTLGVGAPYAIAAAVAHPDRTVGIVFGDGAFGFNGMEYDTMVRLGLPIIGVVGNDGVWNNIKTFHRMLYPDRLVASDLGVRPYHEMVTALGGYGEFVDRPEEIRPALERARESGLPSLVNVHIAETMRMSSNYSQ
ncbi:MAG: thiamine pyrophosphate-dependent enzyme, partial [Acidimicrobiia bacterium]|nr:thiamine pyrophosphate-dependent enzyme [Acidimicrobiia bacterium]